MGFNYAFILVLVTTADLRIKHGCYVGSQLGKYIPRICVGITDSFDWEEFLISNYATTISTELETYYHMDSFRDTFVQNFEVTLNATHPQLCYDIDYSKIETYLYTRHEEFYLDLLETNISSGYSASLHMRDSCKCNSTLCIYYT